MLSSKKNFLLIFWIVLLSSSGQADGGQDQSYMDEVRSDRIVLKFKEDLVQADMEPTLLFKLLGENVQKRGLTRLVKPRQKRVHPVKVSPAAARMSCIFCGQISVSADQKAVLAWLQRHPLIEYAEPLYNHSLHISPDDSFFAQQPHLAHINLPAAWDFVRGAQGTAVIAIVDGGTDIRHQDLLANLWVNIDEIAGNRLDDDDNGFIDDIKGWNFANDSNDPTGLPTQPAYGNHGTHTAGIANAVTDNTRGIAGAAWNAQIMAINAADPFGEGIGNGYEAILYAAENGADIINCSWGRTGLPSAFEQDVINYATSLGSIIVASAGNSGSTTRNYPACYPNVFAVAATNNWDLKASFSTYGDWIDVSAPGIDILSTISNNSFGRYSGTSMAAPLAAGVIALVKTKNTDWTGFQCAEQVRATSYPIDDKNPAFAGLIGMGRIDASKAMVATTPSIRLTAVHFVGGDSDSQFRPGEAVQIYATLTNYLAPSASLTLALSENSNHVTLGTSMVNIPGLSTLESATQTLPFEIMISHDAPAGHVVEFTLHITTGGFSDTDHFTLTVSPNFVNLNINRILTSVTSVGRIGYAMPSEAIGGSGFIYHSGANLIYEGSIIAGTSATQISSSSRGMTPIPDQDFASLETSPLVLLRPGLLTDEESTVSLEDLNAEAPMEIAVSQQTFASNHAGYEDFIIFRYKVKNKGKQALSNFHFGLFIDWDVDIDHYNANVADWDATRRLGYVFNVEGEPGTCVGCVLLTPGSVSCRAILNDEEATGNPGWGIYDGFSDAEKWDAISSGAAITRAGAGDVSQVLSAGPYQIDPGEIIVIDFALVAGDELAQMQSHADKAVEFRELYLDTEPDTALLHLDKGWNLVSSWIAPDDSLLANLFAPIADRLVMLKDGQGNVYWPNLQIEMAEYWNWRRGYWIYLTSPADLLMTGQQVSSWQRDLTLNEGWNLISYLLNSPVAAGQALGSITSDLILAKDGRGKVYWPQLNLNSIGEMQPGSGYALFLTKPVTLQWPKVGL